MSSEPWLGEWRRTDRGGESERNPRRERESRREVRASVSRISPASENDIQRERESGKWRPFFVCVHSFVFLYLFSLFFADLFPNCFCGNLFSLFFLFVSFLIVKRSV